MGVGRRTILIRQARTHTTDTHIHTDNWLLRNCCVSGLKCEKSGRAVAAPKCEMLSSDWHAKRTRFQTLAGLKLVDRLARLGQVGGPKTYFLGGNSSSSWPSTLIGARRRTLRVKLTYSPWEVLTHLRKGENEEMHLIGIRGGGQRQCPTIALWLISGRNRSKRVLMIDMF